MKKLLLCSIVVLSIPLVIVNLIKPISNDISEIGIYIKEPSVRVNLTREDRIKEVPLEDYIVGVVAAEMPVTFHEEALKAQSVAARNYVLRKMEENQDNEYDINDTVMHQVFSTNERLKERWGDDFEVNLEKISNAVMATAGEFLDYNGKIANTLYFSTSNGRTENNTDVFGADLSYLTSVESPWDQNVSPAFNDMERFTIKDFNEKFDINNNNKPNINIMNRSSTNRVLKISVNGEEFTGIEFRHKLGLRSTDFDIQVDNNNVVITTKGFGHGVGMSQYGAHGKAMEGYSYRDILAHFYQGTTLKRL